MEPEWFEEETDGEELKQFRTWGFSHVHFGVRINHDWVDGPGRKGMR